eukprot:jgi/Mesen1/4045/ME000213S03076
MALATLNRPLYVIDRLLSSCKKEEKGKHLKGTFFGQAVQSTPGGRHVSALARSKVAGARADWKELVGVLIFSAAPFATVKAIANSSLGERLQARMNESKAEGQARAAAAAQAQAAARQQSYEILHARWAMLGALGALIPELLVRATPVSFSEPVWWNVGLAKLQGDTLDYLGVPGLHIAGAQGVLIIAVAQVLLMVGPEYARYCGIEALEPLGIYLPGDINYPGGVFDPLGLTQDAAAFEDLKVRARAHDLFFNSDAAAFENLEVKEMKNGRLAMVAWLGFYIQALVTQKGPVQNVEDFLTDPVHNNVFAYLSAN